MYTRILVPVDGSKTSNLGLEEAIGLAELTGARLRLVHVLDNLAYTTGFETGQTYVNDVIPRMHREGERILQNALAGTSGRVKEVETCLLEPSVDRTATRVIGEAKAWNADLIVLGTHGRHGIDRLMLGSDAEQILRSSPIPVLLVRAPQRGSEGG